MPVAPRIILLGPGISGDGAQSLGVVAGDMPIDTSGDFLVTGKLRTSVVVRAWYKVFVAASERPPLQELEEISSITILQNGTWHLLRNVVVISFAAHIDSLEHISAGKDGLHNYCYKYGGKSVLQILARLIDSFLNDQPPPAGAREGLILFLPEGEKEDDRDLSSEGVDCAPLDSCLSSFENSDKNIVAGCLNCMIKPAVETAACTPQN